MLSANATYNGKRVGDMNNEEFDVMVQAIKKAFPSFNIESFVIADEAFSKYRGEVFDGNCLHGALL